jgi:CHAD domain-containing protein
VRAAGRTFGETLSTGEREGDGAATNGPVGRGHGELALVAQALSASRSRVQLWTLSERSAESVLAPRVKSIYREGRRRWTRVAGGKRSAKAFHRWRKEVKDLRYTAEVLGVREHPRAKAGTRGSERLAKLARRADALSETLGVEHDLAVLAELVREHEPLRAHKRSRRTLLRAIEHRQARLRRDALRAGASLYARKPKRFMGWLRAF